MTATPNRPRVLQLIGSFHQGGSERQAIQLLRLLLKSGRYDVSLAALDVSGPLGPAVEAMGFSSVPEFPLTSFYDKNMAKQVLRFRQFLKEQRIAIIHTHDFYTNVFGAFGTMGGRRHLICSRRELGGMRTQAQQWVERRAYNVADVVVANAGAVRDALIAEGVQASKVAVLYNGLDLERVATSMNRTREQTVKSLGLPTDPSVQFVTMVANIHHPVKDHPMFLRAAARMYREFPLARFVLAGEGELLEPMRTLAHQLGIGEATIFLGRCDRVAELLSVSNVCVLSSNSEGFSNSILEYMAAGKPVVATRVGGAAEAIEEGETGYLVESGDDEAMADRWLRLLQNPEAAQRMGQQAHDVVTSKFSTAAQCAGAEALYSKLLGR